MGSHQRYRPHWLLPVQARIIALGVVAAVTSAAGLVVTPAASASTGTTVYSSTGSGYEVSGRWFHYVKTRIELPTNALCAQLYKVVHPGTFSVMTELSSPDTYVQLVISNTPTSAGCGKYAATWVHDGTVTAVPFPMAAGDRIKMWTFYDQTSPPISGEHSVGRHLFNATTGAGSAVGDLANATFTNAQIIGGFGSFTAPATQFRAFEFTNSAVETYTGARGTLTGPWTTSQVVMTSNGQSSGAVEASSPVLWDGGRNFGTWARAATSG
jgi:hypothetical protein